MNDGFPLPDWFPRPETWPSWMPKALRNGGLGPPSPSRDLRAWPTFDWGQGPSGGLIGRPNEFGERLDPYWWESITPAPPDTSTGGLLGHLLAPRDAGSGGLLGNLGTPRDSGGGGLLGNLGTLRDSGNRGILGHLSAPPEGPRLFDPGPELKGGMPWDWSKLPIPSELSPTVWPTPPSPATPPMSSIDAWKQGDSLSLGRGRFNWVETPNGGLLAVHPNENDVDWVETPSGGLLAVPKPQMNPSWLRSAMAFGTGASAAPEQPNDQLTERPSFHDAGPTKWDSPALPEPSASPPIFPSAAPGMWGDLYQSQMPFDANAGSPATPVQQDHLAWPNPSLASGDLRATEPSPLGVPPLPPTDAQTSPDVGRNFHWWQLPFDANTRIPAAPAQDHLWPDASLRMRDTSVPDHDPTTDLTAVVSDVDPETWIAGLRYANRTGRGPRGPGGRQLSPPEENLLWFYGSAHRTLRELDPTNRQLQSVSSETWIPRQEDINRLNEEIARVRREQSLHELERHHTLPRQFAPRFNKAGIDIEDYIVYVARSQHRLPPTGLHTGSDHWNAQWTRFFEMHKNPSPSQILEQLNTMLRQLPR